MMAQPEQSIVSAAAYLAWMSSAGPAARMASPAMATAPSGYSEKSPFMVTTMPWTRRVSACCMSHL